MGCAQGRHPEKDITISCEIKYLLPELLQSIRLAQQCLYSPESPIKLTPIKEINGIQCKIERVLPSGSVKMRAMYHMIFRLQQKKRYKGMEDLNLVLCSTGNAATAAIECLKLLKPQKKQDLQMSEIMQDDTPTDPGLSVEIKDQQLKSIIKPYELTGNLIIFAKHFGEIHNIEEQPNVTIIQSNANKNDIELEAFSFADKMCYDYLDIYNDMDVFGGYATVGFEIDQWTVLTKNQVDNIFITLKNGALIAAIAFYLRQETKNQARIIGVMLLGSQMRENTLCSQISQSLIDEVIFVTTQEVEMAQCELAKAEEIAEFNSAIAYAGCKKSKYKHSMVVLSGGNVSVNDLSKLIKKYDQ